MSVLVISITLLYVLSGNFRTIQGKNILGPIPDASENRSNSVGDAGDDAAYARVYRLPDGEVVTKLQWSNTTAVETQYSDIDLIQIIQGNNAIQLWKSNGQLVDCEFTSDSQKVAEVKTEFEKVNPNIHNDKKNIYLQNVETLSNFSNGLPHKFAGLVDYNGWMDACAKHHEKIRSAYKEKLEMQKTSNRRSKRELFVFPGTNWCGKGSSSHAFEDLGDSAFADRCCRDHDRCKYSIGAFERRFHLFNLRPHYVSHCSCDERFRSCLKLANSGTSNLIGKIYFNVVQTKCFMFEFQPICEEHSWWGSCITSKRRKRAVFRDPMYY